MSAFPDWQKYAVPQKRKRSGCIPTAYETLLRAAHVEGVNFETFQDEFDLDQSGGVPRNHFGSVADAVRKKYPAVDFVFESFAKGDGQQKLKRVEEFVSSHRPVIVSLANERFGHPGWHIMVVVDATEADLIMLQDVSSDGTPITETVSKHDFVKIHDSYKGGDEIAYLRA